MRKDTRILNSLGSDTHEDEHEEADGHDNGCKAVRVQTCAEFCPAGQPDNEGIGQADARLHDQHEDSEHEGVFPRRPLVCDQVLAGPVSTRLMILCYLSLL